MIITEDNITFDICFKTTFNINYLKILRPKVTKNLTNLLKRFVNLDP